jgi:hypothetical protein
MFQNKTNIDLALAVWLADPSGYDLNQEEYTISATTLQKPLRAIVLGARAMKQGTVDLVDLVRSRLGTAVHSAAEESWKSKSLPDVLHSLGVPKEDLGLYRVNPTTPKTSKDQVDVFLENRVQKKIAGFTISGKYDFVINGQLKDIKSTSTFAYIKGGNERDYQLQGSIYRWLNPELITEDYVHLLYLFTDWKEYLTLSDPKYPKHPIVTKKIPLLSLYETEMYIRDRLEAITVAMGLPEDQLPECSSEELWQTPTKYAVYLGLTTNRATRVFDTHQEALAYGIKKKRPDAKIIERPGKVKRCRYCSARPICTQSEKLELQGLLD